EVHEILKEYELKYCFVDRNKGTDLFSPRLCNNPPQLVTRTTNLLPTNPVPGGLHVMYVGYCWCADSAGCDVMCPAVTKEVINKSDGSFGPGVKLERC
ncbi:hypothetical protein ILYODFUR_007178, partial [Ilyodon furcidens]